MSCASPQPPMGMDIIRLATPTTDDGRLAAVLNGASGFLYYVSIAGVTGTKSYAEGDLRSAVSAPEEAKPYFRARSVSASRRQNRPALSPASPTAWS